jgi:ankyrin repeat protein
VSRQFFKNIKSENSKTPEIFEWVEKNEIQKVKNYVLKKGDPNAKRDSNGFTLLMSAVMHNRIEIAKLLIKNGADLNVIYKPQKPNLANLLFFAITDDKKLEMLELLLKNNINLNCKIMGGETPLTYTLMHKLLNSFKLILNYTEEVNIPASFYPWATA